MDNSVKNETHVQLEKVYVPQFYEIVFLKSSKVMILLGDKFKSYISHITEVAKRYDMPLLKGDYDESSHLISFSVAMGPPDMETYISSLKQMGLIKELDYAVTSQLWGMVTPCSWIKFEKPYLIYTGERFNG